MTLGLEGSKGDKIDMMIAEGERDADEEEETEVVLSVLSREVSTIGWRERLTVSTILCLSLIHI